MIHKFGEIYQSLRLIEQAAAQTGVDLDNTFGDESKGIVSDELKNLQQAHMSLYNASISTNLNIDSVRKQIDVCMPNMDVF